MSHPIIICLCGSTKFKKEFEEIAKQETLKGKIVLTCHVFRHSGDIVTEEQKKALNELHLHKIDMADEIKIINVNGYMGEGTSQELKYAQSYPQKKIYYLED